LIEDDPQAAAFIVKGLMQSGHLADHAPNGRDGLMVAASAVYDVMIIDRMLPGIDGLSVVRTLRSMGNHTPVLVLSALGDVDDRVEGLKAGGDDYLVKPFAFSELLARLEALARRKDATVPATRLAVGDLEMDLLARIVRRAGQAIDLKPREFRLLEVLMRNAGQVVTRTMLLERVWDYHFDPQTNVIDVHMSRLRNKIDKDFSTALIHTVRGAGYMIRAPESASRARRA
jgi:two-component system OmpR family response regulator